MSKSKKAHENKSFIQNIVARFILSTFHFQLNLILHAADRKTTSLIGTAPVSKAIGVV
jgi:hypothetical protein